MRRKRLWRVIRAWLLPARHLESASGWVQLIWLAVVLVVPAGIVGVVRETGTSASWKTPWALVAVGGVLLLLALRALWLATPSPTLSLSLGPLQTPLAVDHNGNVVDTRYWHCQVHSPSPVLNCTGELIGVEVERVGSFQPEPAFKPPLSLVLDSVPGTVWTRIERGLPARINLVFQQSDQLQPFLAVESHAPAGNLTFLPPGYTYRLTVRFRAEGVASVDGRFLVRATSKWSDLDVALEG